jgi:predicted O-linked N-acetylglucosamine transferase (SPINDLY family)
LGAQGKRDESIVCFARALELRPDLTDAHVNLGNALLAQGKLVDAAACYRRALELDPGLAEAYSNLGVIFQQQGAPDQAVACYRRAVELKPLYTVAHHNLGNALREQGKMGEAAAAYSRALELQPDFVEAHSNLVYTQIFAEGCDAEAIQQEHRRWDRLHAASLEKLVQPPLNDPSPDRRLRIGYVSPNFCDHVVGRNLWPLFREHDHQNFELYFYSDAARADELTSRLQGCADVWRETADLQDADLAERVREDRIDILVDLTLHMGRHRLLAFARRPAPVQATFAGYPGTTGLSAMDFRLTDPHLDPPGLHDHCYSEESIRLPESFWCYDPFDSEPGASDLPAAQNGYITFGSLNNFCKVNRGALKLWARVLNAVARSRLTVLAGVGSCRERTLEALEEEGVARDRVTFVPKLPRPSYLRQYRGIDIELDTVPYNGHTTSLDSLWMGVPVVTLVGPTVVGRAGLSQLTNLGLPELIAYTPEQYLRIATELAHDLPRLSRLRSTLRGRMEASPLMDAPRFTRNIEAAFRQMWRRWCASPSAT